MGKPKTQRALKDNEAKAVLRMLRISPQKLNLLAKLIRGKKVEKALAELEFSHKRISGQVKKVLESAIANLRVKADKASEAFDERNLVISEAFVDEGPTMKRFRPRAQGRAARINKRTSHITVVVTPKTTKGGTR